MGGPMTSYRNADPRPPIMAGSPVPPEWRVPRMDWDRPPWNRWAFQHIREFLPTVEVRRGEGPASAIANAHQDIGGIEFTAADGSRMSVDQMLEATYTDGFIVIHAGRVVHESYFNAMTPRTVHLSQSVAKSVVGTVAGTLIGRGLLDPQARVTDILPELEATAWRGAKLQHVLDMTSGVAFDEEYTSPTSDIGQTDVASGWKPASPDDFNWPDCVWSQILGLTVREAEHGARFKYRSIETDVLAFCLERVSGRRLAELVSEELWAPMGAEENACFTVDSAGYALADGGFNACLRDYARLGLVYLNNGYWNGRQIVPAEWIADIRRGAHGLFNDEARAFLPNGRYRNQFWIEDASREIFMALGVFGQMIYVSPENDLVAVKLSSEPEFLETGRTMTVLRAIDAISSALA
jgi:hypothetical protein